MSRLKFRFTCSFLALAALGWTQQQKIPEPNAGAVFAARCAYCHGAHGEGGRGADLTTGQFRHGSSDAELFSVIRNGIPGTEMPAVGLNDDQARALVVFVKQLSAAGPAEKAPGDPLAGKALYEGRGGCRGCHSIGAEGGSLGPDLSDIGRRRNLKYLTESLVSPDADVAIPYRPIHVVTRSGEDVAGIRLNEDDASIQLRDTHDNLRSFLKQNVREIRHEKTSLMPGYGSTLTPKEIEDIVAYLNSLRGAR